MDAKTWHEWRKLGIGASDAPVIMGVSPWKSRRQLWQEKIADEVKVDSGNWATRRGNALEPAARATYELTHEIEMPAKLVVHPKHQWLRASLDGYNEEAKVVLEIKCPGNEDHALAVAGKVPEKYLPQIQHQLMVTGARVAHYYSFDGTDGVVVRVEPDADYQTVLFAKEFEFWQHVTNRTEPPAGPGEAVQIKDKAIIKLAQSYEALATLLKHVEKEMEQAKALLLEGLVDEKADVIEVDNLRIGKVVRAGTVDYKTVVKDFNVDLEKYRKAPTYVTTVRILKRDEGDTSGA